MSWALWWQIAGLFALLDICINTTANSIIRELRKHRDNDTQR